MISIGACSEKYQPTDIESMDDNEGSDDDFSNDETEIVPPSVASRNDSLAGDKLRQFRKNSQEDDSMNNETLNIQSIIEHDLDAAPQVQVPSQDVNIEQGNILQNLRIDEGRPYVTRRLRTLQLELSESQPDTPGDGNCFVHALADQTL